MLLGLRAFIAIAVCKILHAGSRVLRRGGTAMPGHIALLICPDLLNRLSGSVTSIAVTGTNGKTTTSRMIEETLSGLQEAIKRSYMNGSTMRFLEKGMLWKNC